ncbi:MAG: molybdate ABC transporter substrate-binding protein [Clostridia bacterium]|nr:molybdate ABC transporter substrate-binding protein [Clostridia bacterium]
MKYKIFMLMVVMLVIMPGCNAGKHKSSERQKEIIVFSAASLTESLTELCDEYHKKNHEVKLILNFAPSQALKASIESGTRADIFISASLNEMDQLKKNGFVQEYKVFLKNRLVIARSKNSKFNIKDIKDLAAPGLKLAAADKNVPVGFYWEKGLELAVKKGAVTEEDKALIEKNIITRELNVKDVLSKVLFGEVDAGIVYMTDVAALDSEKLETVDSMVFRQLDAVYPIAIIKESASDKEVRKLYDFILSKDGKNFFEKYRFIAD